MREILQDHACHIAVEYLQLTGSDGPERSVCTEFKPQISKSNTVEIRHEETREKVFGTVIMYSTVDRFQTGFNLVKT